MEFPWAQWTPDDIRRKAENAIAQKRDALTALKTIPASERTFANTIGALERASDSAADVEQTLQLLLNVHPEAVVRESAQTTCEWLKAQNVELDYDRDLWRAAQEWLATGELERLTGADRKLADDTLRDLRRMGFGLSDVQFTELKALRTELEKVEQEFEKAINDWDDGITVTREQLAGLPERYVEGLTKLPDGRYRVSLQYPDLFPFMRSADDDTARRELATKNLTKGGMANLERLAELIRLRQRIAALLGYKTHADYAGEVRMAHDGYTVATFLRDIIAKLQSTAQQELRDLVDIKKRTLKLEHPKPIHFHEIAYWSNKLKEERYQLSTEKVKEYFPLAKVMSGMFTIYQQLLGLTFERLPGAKLWHDDAEAYTVRDTASGELIGHFLLDLYPRTGKFNHAASFPIILGRTTGTDGAAVPGIIALVCNFPKLTQANPSLLAHDEVETLLHEFGHVIHALVSGKHRHRQNGFGVSLDFVEAPSQLSEYWAWKPESLVLLSGHWQTGELLPKEFLDKLLATKRHMQASYFLSQAVRALYDLTMHAQPVADAVEPERIAQIYRDMKLQYEHIDLPDDAIFAAGWSHMVDYDAGYYSYLWSRVYAADMFTAFAPAPLDTVVGARYRQHVLAPGASAPELSLVRTFLGREPSNAAFLAELGVE